MTTTAGDGLTAGQVARRLGVAVTTLRAWHRRYGLGPSRHERQKHRRYTDQDLARLETMCRLTGRGVPAAEAARAALSQRPAAPTPEGRDGGGHAIAVGRAGPAARGLARAAMRLDTAAMARTVATAIRERGVVHAWDDVLRPVLAGVGEHHAETGDLVEVEHLLSRVASEGLAAVPRPAGPARTLLACADEEQHSLPIEALAAALAERGHASRLLGARVPARALADAVRRTGPAVVVVWSHAAATAQLPSLPVPPLLTVAAGPGWDPGELPDGVAHPATLDEALTLVLAHLPA